jgi:XTP/dITP diphosphohydrolase
MTTFVIATRNRHKVGEIAAVLGPDFRYLTLAALPGAPAVIEDAPTFAGNAAKKAVALARWLAGRPPAWERTFVLADDSGLEVDALGGAPGVLSARFAAMDAGQTGNSTDAENNAKLLRLLAGVPPERRTARFRCAIAVAPVSAPVREPSSPVCYADEIELATRVFEGACEGRILLSPRGGHGFGYDPLFQPDGFDRTFAELGEAVKNGISHRARALVQLKAWLTAGDRRAVGKTPG